MKNGQMSFISGIASQHVINMTIKISKMNIVINKSETMRNDAKRNDVNKCAVMAK